MKKNKNKFIVSKKIVSRHLHFPYFSCGAELSHGENLIFWSFPSKVCHCAQVSGETLRSCLPGNSDDTLQKILDIDRCGRK